MDNDLDQSQTPLEIEGKVAGNLPKDNMVTFRIDGITKEKLLEIRNTYSTSIGRIVSVIVRAVYEDLGNSKKVFFDNESNVELNVSNDLKRIVETYRPGILELIKKKEHDLELKQKLADILFREGNRLKRDVRNSVKQVNKQNDLYRVSLIGYISELFDIIGLVKGGEVPIDKIRDLEKRIKNLELPKLKIKKP